MYVGYKYCVYVIMSGCSFMCFVIYNIQNMFSYEALCHSKGILYHPAY